MDADMIRFIRQEIKREVNVILAGQAGVTTQESEDIQNLFPGSPTIPARPVMHPYGFTSRAKQGTISVTARHGDHVGNRIILGHRDSERPDDFEEGEVVLYNQFGLQMRLLEDRILIGSADSDKNAVLGPDLQAMLSTVLQAIAEHVHIGNLGYNTSPPVNASLFNAQKASPVDDGGLLSDKIFIEK